MRKVEKILGVVLAILILLSIGGYFLNSVLVIAGTLAQNEDYVIYKKVNLALANPCSNHNQINLIVNDFLLISSDRYPIIPSFFDLKLEVNITGDWCLEYIREVSPLPKEKDGSGELSALFWARQKGTSEVQITITDADNKEVEKTVYKVKVK